MERCFIVGRQRLVESSAQFDRKRIWYWVDGLSGPINGRVSSQSSGARVVSRNNYHAREIIYLSAEVQWKVSHN